MATRTPAPAEEFRQTGWPCHGDHAAMKFKGNQFGSWTVCSRCGLCLDYTVTGTGKRRTAGPQQHSVRQGLEELQMEYDAEAMTENLKNPRPWRHERREGEDQEHHGARGVPNHNNNTKSTTKKYLPY